MKVNFENSWAPHPGFDPRTSRAACLVGNHWTTQLLYTPQLHEILVFFLLKGAKIALWSSKISIFENKRQILMRFRYPIQYPTKSSLFLTKGECWKLKLKRLDQSMVKFQPVRTVPVFSSPFPVGILGCPSEDFIPNFSQVTCEGLKSVSGQKWTQDADPWS